MKSKLLASSIVAVALLFVGCGDNTPKFDTSSEDAYTKSGKKVMEKLSLEDQEKIKGALFVIGFSGVDLLGGKPAAAQENLMKAIHGKTAKEVIEMGAKIAQESKKEHDKKLEDFNKLDKEYSEKMRKKIKEKEKTLENKK